MVGPDRRRISLPPMLLSVRLRWLADQDREEAGIRSTGVFESLSLPFSLLARRTNLCIREKLYAFFMSLKQPDGSFFVAHEAEIDVR